MIFDDFYGYLFRHRLVQGLVITDCTGNRTRQAHFNCLGFKVTCPECRCHSPTSPHMRKMLFLPSSMSELPRIQRRLSDSHCLGCNRLPRSFFFCRYFTSRPDLLSRVGGAGVPEEPPSATNTAGTAAIASAAQRAMTKNPAATSRLIAAGINHANGGPSRSGNSAAKLASAANVGRVAAAAQVFSTSSASPPPKATSPPVAPRADSSRLIPQKVSPGCRRHRSSPFIVERIYLANSALSFPSESPPLILLARVSFIRYAERGIWE